MQKRSKIDFQLNRIFLRHAFLLFGIIFSYSSSFAQTKFESEEELIKAANEFFEEENYEKALPLYSQLVSLYPKDASYNMKYGYSLLHADADKSACLKYLKYGASKSESGEMARYYYARGLHSNYDFAKAISQYQKFKSVASKKDVENLAVDRQIEMCNNGKELLKNFFDLNVIEKKEINRSEFFRSYQLGEIGGKIIVKPDEFKTKLDFKSDDISLIHLPSEATVVYFSGYNDDKSKGKDIFRIRKNGTEWSSPENIGSVVNTNYDEDYPFMHPDGTLYFASKGHNSMGGYDLFKSEFNESTNTWSSPENLNFPVNSVFDDVLFISDYKKQLAYFASGRATTDGKFNVYRVQIARKPFDKAFLAGNFISEGSAKVNSAKITIYDVENNQKVGTYFTDKNSGKYNISLPKGGKTYKFVVETDEDSPVHTGKVEVPVQEDMQSMKQEIRLVGDGDQQKLVIKNMFNETAPIDESMLVASLQNASNLEVNSTEAQVLNDISTNTTETSTENPESAGSLKEKHEQLMADMTMLQAEIKNDLSALKNQIAFGFKYSFEKSVVADQMYDQVEVARQAMINEKDKAAKQKKMDELLVIKEKLDPIASDAIVSYDFTRSLANEYDEKINDQDRISKDLANMKESAATSDQEMQADLSLYGPGVADMKSMSSSFEIAPKRYEDLLAKSKEKLEREKTFYSETKQDLDALQLELSKMEKEIEEAKNKKTKEQLEAEKGSKEIDLQDLEFEFASISKKYKALKSEVKNLESDSKQINAFISKIKANKQTVAQLSNEDQTELNTIIDFLKEQRLLEDVIGDEIEAFMTQTSAKESLTKAQKYQAIDNNGKSVDYDELYMVNAAALEMLEDEESKYEELSKLYGNWASTIEEDKDIKNNDLAYTEDKAQKDILEEKLNILDEKEKEYRQISVEYQEKAAALSQVAINESVEGQSTEIEGIANEESGSKPKGQKDGGSKEAKASKSVNELLATSFVAASISGSSSAEDINKEYEESKKSFEKELEDGIAAEISLAAFELSWAKSIDDLIQEKVKEQEGLSQDDPKWKELQASIDKFKVERDEHVNNASGEFTSIQIEQQLGDSPAEEMSKYYIPFDPEDPNFESYNEEYRKLVQAVENHQILTREQKDKELSMIHNYWSMTIQDEILWQEKEKTKLKSQSELLEIENKVLDLNVAKKEHIKLSNEYYQKYKSGSLYKEDMAVKEAKVSAGIAENVSAEEANSFGEYAAVYANYKAEKEARLKKMESDMDQVGSKGEKQQIALSMALMQREMKEEEEAEKELNSKSNAPILSEESVSQLEEKNEGSWKEKAEDYVFTKKDFASDVPENATALESYQEARSAYDEVKYLESQKTGLLTSSVVNKNAEQELIELQDQIDAKKLEAYESLAKANKVQYQSNKKEIEQLMAANPDLEKTNPKLYRDIQAADVIYNEVESYLENAKGFKSNKLKFDIYDQAQFMSEYVLNEQEAIIVGLQGETYTGELAFLAASEEGNSAIEEELADFKIERKEMQAIVENPIFQEYEKDRVALEEIKKERKTLEAEVVNEENQLKLLVDQRNMIVQTAAGQKKGKKKKLMKEAEVIEGEIAVQQKKVDSVTLEMIKLKEQENNINRNSARLLKQASVDDRYKMIMLAELRLRDTQEANYISEGPVESKVFESEQPEVNIEEESTPVQEGVSLPTATTTLNNDEFKTLGTEIPQELEGDLFITAATTTVSPYSDNKPIPVDVDIPKGLVFKVQIGAYRNPIPQDLFKGFAPLMGEKLDNGITRYTAGLFRDFGNANKAKNEIRKIGYDDAFVVAFVDGKRISFQELQGLEDIEISLPPPVADNTYNGVPPEVLTTPSIIDDEGEISSAIAEQTTNTMEIQGIFFAVQVGVYTNTLLPEQLKVFRELNSELMPNGNVRYSVGQFKTVEEARARRENVTSEVADAFVTAYENGRRISVGEALNKLNQ